MTNKGYTPAGDDNIPKPPKGGTGESGRNAYDLSKGNSLVKGRNGPPPRPAPSFSPLPPPPVRYDINITHRYINNINHDEKTPKPEAEPIFTKDELNAIFSVFDRHVEYSHLVGDIASKLHRMGCEYVDGIMTK
jgi:hypothetical protein